MAKLFFVDLDLQQNTLIAPQMDNQATAPSTPVDGQQYFDTATNLMYYWDGTQWVAMGASVTQSVLDWKNSVVARTTQDLSNEAYAAGGVTYANGTAGVGATLTQDTPSDGAFDKLDGITITAGDRVLIMDQTAGLENGIYTLTTVGDGVSTPWVMTRVTDADEGTELQANASCFVNQGVLYADSAYTQTADNVTVGTTALTFVKFTGTGNINAGAGLSKVEATDTLNVGDAGKGVQVNADDVEIDASESAGNGIAQNVTNSWQFDTDGAAIADNGLVVGTSAHQIQTSGSAIAGVGLQAGTNTYDIDIDAASSTEAEAQSLNNVVVTPASLVNFTKEYLGTITGNGSLTSFAINHAFNNAFPQVHVYKNDTLAMVTSGVDVVATDANNVTISFDVAPPATAAGVYKVVVTSK
jgi:hypothetical protein